MIVEPGDGTATQLAVSADGRMLAWVESPCQGRASLEIEDLRTRGTAEHHHGRPAVRDGQAVLGPGRSPPGLLLPGWRRSGLRAVRYDPASGRRLETLFTFSPSSGGSGLLLDQVRTFDLSSDGQAAIYELVLDGDRSQIHRWSGGTPVPIPAMATQPTW